MNMFTDKHIIDPTTLQLLQSLQSDSQLQDFFFVGGTSLAMQIGHRLSIDLDLFTLESFDENELELYLFETYSFQTDKKSSNTLIGNVNGIKVDFIRHPYTLVNPLIQHDAIRFASVLDIGAMKLNAVSQSGQRQKDFYDLYFILEHFCLNDLLQAYQTKYPNSNKTIPLKAMVWFDDIDFEVEKPVLKRKVTFAQVKKRLVKAAELGNLVF